MVWYKDWIGPYKSVRFIEVQNWRLALANYSIQLFLFLYILIFQVWQQKHYQKSDAFTGTVHSKIKGVSTAVQNVTLVNLEQADAHHAQVFDIYDVVMPPLEENAIFIATSIFSTKQQTRGMCPGRDKSEKCTFQPSQDPHRSGSGGETSLVDCRPGEYYTNGVATGQCHTSGYCLLQAWCPIENTDTRSDAQILANIDQWSLYIQVQGDFVAFGKHFDNLARDDSTKDKKNAASASSASAAKLIRGLNLFYIHDILDAVNTTYEAIAENGMIVQANVKFNCDLDYSDKFCHPKWSWTRLDKPDAQGNSAGYNWRYVDTSHDSVEKRDFRTLNKVYGIRILIDLSGQAGKFDIFNLIMAIGSGLGLLGVSAIVCDQILVRFLPESEQVIESKFRTIAATVRELSDDDVLQLNTLVNQRRVTIEQQRQSQQQQQQQQRMTNGLNEHSLNNDETEHLNAQRPSQQQQQQQQRPQLSNYRMGEHRYESQESELSLLSHTVPNLPASPPVAYESSRLNSNSNSQSNSALSSPESTTALLPSQRRTSRRSSHTRI